MAVRDFMMWFMSPATKAKAEAESRKWIATCPGCGKQTSVWDLGGLRYKAAGTPLRGYTCAGCGTFGMHKVTFSG
jgi:hypothetical protein